MPKKNFAPLSMSLAIVLFCCFLPVNGNVFEKKYDEAEAKIYLRKINVDIQVKTTESVRATWAYESNITDENLKHQLDVAAKLANYTKEIWKETIKYPWKTYKDPDVRRQFQKFSVLGTAILSPSKYKRFNELGSDMQSVYGKAKICNYHNRTKCDLQLEPELTEIFVKSRDPDELRYYWEQWRIVAGKPVREMFKEYVDLANEAAVLNNFTNNAEFWLKDYEANDFKQQVEDLWQQLRPLYLQLHAYVRRRLREQYGEELITKRGPIPAHLLGNMWAQSWGNIYDFTAPYPGKPNVDVTANMVKEGYTPLRMFKLAEEFFTSLNLSPMPNTFWKNSILEKPTDGRDLICHASAWDFYDGKDFRIKQCTRITMEDLNTAHHEMGHIQYFLQYKNQPLVYKEGTNPGRIKEPPRPEGIQLIKQCTRVTFRQLVTVHHEMGHVQYYLQYKNRPKIYKRGANPGFHEAVGDVMALSVSTPKHLRKVGLLNTTEDDDESEINQLFNMALDKIAFLPFGYLIDQWRWSVFEGTTTEKDYNCKWWLLREKYQGMSPSVIRTENDFDPGAKYHIVGNVPYIRYFVSFVIQFQFHRSLCIAAKEFDPHDPDSKPLHKCDIYQSKEAGALLKKMLQMGSSMPWPDAMEVMTGQRKMDASALLDYFALLQTWLEKENKKTGEFIGWESPQRECAWEKQSKKMEGNFEDDNIAYSYAEFVRQDDNSFGSADYLEEIQPSYRALRHRLKKKDFQTNYFLPERKTEKIYKESNTYLPERSYLEDESQFPEMLRPQRHSNEFERRPTEEIQNQGLSNPASYKMAEISTNAVYEKRTKRDEVMKNDLMNEILKKIQYLKSNEDSDDSSLNNKGVNKWILRRDALKNKKKIEDANSEKMKLKNLKQEAELEKIEEDLKNLNENSNPFMNGNFEPNNMNELSKIESEYNFGSMKKKIFDSAVAQKDLMWKAEAIKNEAKKLLENYNFTKNAPDGLNLARFDQYKFPNLYKDTRNDAMHFDLKKTRNVLPLYNTPEHFRYGKSVRVSLNPFENYFKALGLDPVKNNMREKKNVHFKEYNLIGVVPVNDLLFKGKNKKRNLESLENDNSKYVVLVGKLSEKKLPDDAFSSKKEKKSYKQYHYNMKTPVTYNAVVISSGGKTDKSNDMKDQQGSSRVSNRLISHASDTKRTFRNTRDSSLNENQKCPREFYKNEFSDSVKNNKLNTNNIVQYFGCL